MAKFQKKPIKQSRRDGMLRVGNYISKYVLITLKTEIKSQINVFERASEDEIKKLIMSSSSKSCDLDPIPTSVLKNCPDKLITPITDIINISMESSTFPQNLKEELSCKTTTEKNSSA